MASLYHEKQSLQLCAIHALNNLFQKAGEFRKSELDQICENLSPGTFINPHRSVFQLGNYDVNVIMAALQSRGYDTIWFDKRRDIHALCPKFIFGFILNISLPYGIGFIKVPIFRKHWIAIRQIGGQYYNFDSKLNTPELIGTEKELLSYLGDQISKGDREILIVVTSDVSQLGSWSNTCEQQETNRSTSSSIHAAAE